MRRRPLSRAAAAPGRALRRGSRRAPGAVLAALVLVAVLAPLALGGCGNADHFAGLYWEPATGRRIEIRRTGDSYELYYGRDLRPFPAVRRGDELTITDPMGGKTLIRPGRTAGTLQLITGGKTSVLKQLPQHQ